MARRSTSDLAILTGAVGFAVLLWAVLAGATAASDGTILLAIAGVGRSAEWSLSLAHVASFLGDGAVRAAIMVIACTGLILARRMSAAIWFAAAGAGGALASSLLKAMIARPRPDLIPHLDHVTSAAFPSGHAWNGTILFLSLALLAPARWRRPALGLAAGIAAAIGISRIILGVHWPSDVLAGWLGGIAWVALWWKVAQRQHIGRFGR